MPELTDQERALLLWDEEANDGEQLDYDQWEERRSERSRLIVRLMNDL